MTKTRIIAAVLTATFLFSTVGAVTAYAKGGDYEPEYIPIEAEYTPPPVIPEVEEAPPERNPLTPDGTGTVVDNITNENGIEFFTITSAAGNVFFLVIDRQRNSENVYFLNAVTERDLMALAEESGDDYWVISNAPPPIIPGTPTTPEPEIEAEPEPIPAPEPESGGGGGMVILLIILALGGGAAGYYFKVLRPKQQQADMGDDDFDYEDDYTDEADPYNEDDIPPWEVEADKDSKE